MVRLVTLGAAAEAVALLLSSATGDAELQLTLPNTPTFAGVQLFEQ